MANYNINDDEKNLDEIFARFHEEKEKKQVQNPFKFLDPYQKEDRHIFFGREQEVEEIYRKFYKKKFLLVYGQSGTGKTSIVNCGLMSSIPLEDVQFISIRCIDKPFDNYIKDLKKHTAHDSENPLELIEDIYEKNHKSIALVFDQFEEIFILGNRKERRRFIEALYNTIISNFDIRVIFIIREEYLANFSEFDSTFPVIFTNRIRIEKMRRATAAEVIRKSCQAAGIGIEKKLPEMILDKISRLSEIELSYLQVYLDKVYKKSLESGNKKPNLSRENIEAIGDMGDVLESFLEEQLSNTPDPEKYRCLLKTTISPEGTKIRMSTSDPGNILKGLEYDIDKSEIKEMVKNLIDARILRELEDGDSFELRHDALASIIHDWLSQQEMEFIEVQNSLRNRSVDFQKKGFLLDENFLKFILPYETKLLVNPEFKDLILKSKSTFKKKKTFRNRLVILISLFLAVVFLLFSIWNIKERKKTEEANIIAQEQKKKAELHVQKANEELTRARRRLLEVMGVYWLSFSMMDYGDGKLDHIDVLNKFLRYIKKKDYPNMEKMVDLLGQYFSLKSVGSDITSQFVQKYGYNFSDFDFDRFYSLSYSRKPAFVIADLAAKYPTIYMYWSNEQLIATKNLIDVLLQKDHPGIFDRYGKKLTEVEAGQLRFISNLLGFSIAPNEELFEKIIGYEMKSDDEERNEFFYLIQNLENSPEKALYWMDEHKRSGNKSFLTDMHFITGIKRTAQFLEYYRRFLIKNKDKLDKSAYTKGINICKNLLYRFRVDEDIRNINVDNIKKNFPYYLDKLAADAVKAKKYNRAIELYKKILDIYPCDYWAISDMGITYETMDMFDAAKREFEKLVEYWSSEIWSYIYLGRLFYNQEKYGEALEFYQKAKKIDKGNFYLWLGLGSLYSRMGDYREAASAYKKAIEIQPNDSNSWNGLGWVDFLKGSYENALKNFRKAIELNKKYLMAHFNIAETLMAMQNYDDSYRYYKYIFDDLKPDKKFVREVIKNDINKYFIDIEKPVIFAYFIRGFLLFKIREYETAKNDLTTFLTRFKGEKKWISISRKLLGKQ